MVIRRRKHLTLIEGGRRDEARARERLYPVATRKVRATPQKPDPNPPPRAA
jgi:hypothetical protein